MKNRALSCAIAAVIAAIGLIGSCQAGATTAQGLLRNNCQGCHVLEKSKPLTLSRISHQRKTPEGWRMTIARMQLMHHVKISDQDVVFEQDAIRKLIKYLADNQGLAPEETAAYRYALERRDNTIEQLDPELAMMCGRCHSGARVALQRRKKDEWHKLVAFHIGQFPSIEYSMGGRERDWVHLALTRTTDYLASHFPYDTRAWRNWKAVPKPSLAGRWRIVGDMPGKGRFSGWLQARATARDDYALTFDGRFANGDVLQGSGSAIVYTGYEWRGNLELGGRKWLQVMASTADGSRMDGRMFLDAHNEAGIDLHAYLVQGSPRLLSVVPGYVRSGSETKLTLIGDNLQRGDVDLGAGVVIEQVVARTADQIVVQVRAVAAAAPGTRKVTVGKAGLADGLVVYRTIDRVAVQPSYAVARVGDNGGPMPKVKARFEAVAWSAGTDGIAGNADDLRIGTVPAMWSVAPYTEQARKDRDVHFAGAMDLATGVFVPAGAGPNPERDHSTNNTGNLKVIAKVTAGDSTVTGDGHLIVTVQRWNNPPIR